MKLILRGLPLPWIFLHPYVGYCDAHDLQYLQGIRTELWWSSPPFYHSVPLSSEVGQKGLRLLRIFHNEVGRGCGGAAIGYQSPQFVPRDSIIMPTPPTHQPSSVTYPAVITEVFLASPPTISCYLLRQVWHNYTWIYESQTSQECWVKVPSKSTMHIFRPSYPSTKDSCLIVKHIHY